MWSFRKNGRVPEKKFPTGNFFEVNSFGLEHVLKHSESILKKNVFSKNSVENFHHVAIFRQKRLSPREKFSTGKIFRNRLFRSRVRFETFWIDFEKNVFFKDCGPNFHFWSFWPFFDCFWPFSKFWISKTKKNFWPSFRDFWYGYFKP